MFSGFQTHILNLRSNVFLKILHIESEQESSMTKNPYFIGIDVGTGSARAGIFDLEGTMISSASQSIEMWRPKPDYVEQSSENIWNAVCFSVKRAVKTAGIQPDQIKGIGFDATCSLVVLDEHNQPLSVTSGEDSNQNIIVWMDHRAKKEAEEINATKHNVLSYVGGVISPEMQTPKLLWLKRYHPNTWKNAARFFDLPDYLVYRATGEEVRSACSTVCKWTYLGHEEGSSEDSTGRWDDSYFDEIGLGDLKDDGYQKIGRVIRPIGESVGGGLTEKSAKQLGLNPGTPVGVSMIDAHAGGLGVLGMSAGENHSIENNLALIGGTSSCHMAVSKNPAFIDGIWGPYYSAMIPGYWLNEGGQSATGALIDHVIFSSAQSENLKKQSRDQSCTVYDVLNKRLFELADEKGLDDVGFLTHDLHVLPYFHGNRSPRANPSLSGMVSGLKLSSTMDDLALQYLATIQAIAYGTRHIIETMNASGYEITQISATGGGTKNELFLKEHADSCGCTLILPKEQEAVLLGSAVLGGVASGMYVTIHEAMANMNQTGTIIEPKGGLVADYHQAKYNIFKKMYEDERSYNQMMKAGFSSEK